MIVIVQVYPVHLMNSTKQLQTLTEPRTKPTDLGNEYTCKLLSFINHLCCDTVKPAHVIAAVATVVTLAASSAAVCVQSSSCHIQSCNTIDSTIC